MPRGLTRRDLQLAHFKGASFGKRFNTFQRLELRYVSTGAGGRSEPGEVRDVIYMRMGQQNQLYREIIRFDRLQGGSAISSGVKDDRLLGIGIPGQISIHGHIVV